MVKIIIADNLKLIIILQLNNYGINKFKFAAPFTHIIKQSQLICIRVKIIVEN